MANAHSPMPSHATLEAAASWFALLRSCDATAQDRAAWQRWLDAAREHREAWAFVDTISRRFDTFREPNEQRAAVSTLRSVHAPRLTRRQTLNGAIAMAGAALLGFGSQRLVQRGTWYADYRTVTGEVRALTLADGSQVWLNTASALDVDFRADLRRLHLRAGEMLIDTAKDADRPVVVDTEHGRLRALGTRFAVRVFDGALDNYTRLAVTEGAVEVRTADSAAMHVVHAGRELHFDRRAIAGEIATSRAGEAWIRGVLLAEDMPLRDLLDELSRYRNGYFSVAPDVAELRVLGGFPLRDPDKTLQMLEQTLPIEFRQRLPWWTEVAMRTAAP